MLFEFHIFSRELVFEYITALPGASSSYRYIALKIGGTGEGIVREKKQFFLGESKVFFLFPVSSEHLSITPFPFLM